MTFLTGVGADKLSAEYAARRRWIKSHRFICNVCKTAYYSLIDRDKCLASHAEVESIFDVAFKADK